MNGETVIVSEILHENHKLNTENQWISYIWPLVCLKDYTLIYVSTYLVSKKHKFNGTNDLKKGKYHLLNKILYILKDSTCLYLRIWLSYNIHDI